MCALFPAYCCVQTLCKRRSLTQQHFTNALLQNTSASVICTKKKRKETNKVGNTKANQTCTDFSQMLLG